jgi:hypothetical protein
MRSSPLALVAVVVAVLVAGCGGGGPKIYTLEKTRACLVKKSELKLRNKVDFVASTALGGAVAVILPKNEVTISFGLDEAEAGRLRQAYRRFRGRNIGIEDVLRPEKNAVLLWEAHPSDDELDTVGGCLK